MMSLPELSFCEGILNKPQVLYIKNNGLTDNKIENKHLVSNDKSDVPFIEMRKTNEKREKTVKTKAQSIDRTNSKNGLNNNLPNIKDNNKDFQLPLVELSLDKLVPNKTANVDIGSKSSINTKDLNTAKRTCTNDQISPTYKQKSKVNLFDIDANNTAQTDLSLKVQPLKQKVVATEKKTISGKCFKDIVYKFLWDDFCNLYRKFNSEVIPDCSDLAACKIKHRYVRPMELQGGPVLNILDSSLATWTYDLCTDAFCALRPEIYFSGDVLRILFDYILNGPSEELMWGIKHLVSSHFDVHPPCTKQMRQLYLQLLDVPCDGQFKFKTELAKMGVLNYIMKQLEQYYQKPPRLVKCMGEVGRNDQEVKTDCKQEPYYMQTITFNMLEDRYNNCQPLLDNEHNQVIDALDDIAGMTSQETVNLFTRHQILEKLVVALELIVDLLEADFLICVSKLKRHIAGENPGSEVETPLIKLFMDKCLHTRVFKLYAETVDTSVWALLSRLISMMAEHVHLFKPSLQGLWQYPDVHEGCSIFTIALCDTINKCKWSEEERLARLGRLHPPWLQLQVAMTWVNSKLNIQMFVDLKAIVEIIHMHVISPVKFEKVVKKIKTDNRLMNSHSASLAKRAVKRNQYGETLLHRVCKQKGSSMSQLHSLLSVQGIDVNAKDNYGWTPLHETVGAKSLLKTKTLLQYQLPSGRMAVDIGAQNCKGFTALHEAVVANNLQLCQLLVEYGGVCLLRKTDCEGVTPLELSKQNLAINYYFERVIKAQELLNLSSDSVLNLPEHVLCLLMMACDAFISDNHTQQVYQAMFDGTFTKVTPKKWIVVNQNTLLKFKHEQDQLRKLRRILTKLAENPKNSPLVQQWASKFQPRTVHVQNSYVPVGISHSVFRSTTTSGVKLKSARQLLKSQLLKRKQ